MTGWITVISWQAAIASASYLGGAMIQGLIILAHPEYSGERWHGTLLFYAVIALALFINTILAPVLPHIESAIFVIHVVGFFAVLIPMVYFTSPRASAPDVFATFNNGGMWPADGLSFMVGLIPSMFTFIGLDAASHMAEEIHEASSVIPKSMILSALINGVLGFTMVIAVLFCLGDIDSVLETATGFPFIQIFFNSTQSIGGTIAMSSLVISAMIFAGIGVLATGSRMTWAFARERGLPMSTLLAQVHRRSGLPLYSIGISVSISLLLALINIGSSTAFNALTSLVIASFYSSYTLAAAVFLHKRLTTPEEAMQYGPFQLGRAGVPVTIASLVYSSIGTFFSFWPPAVNPDPESMNWSVLVFGFSIIVSLVFWFTHGRRRYNGPLMEIVHS